MIPFTETSIKINNATLQYKYKTSKQHIKGYGKEKEVTLSMRKIDEVDSVTYLSAIIYRGHGDLKGIYAVFLILNRSSHLCANSRSPVRSVYTTYD